ncbi:hypothetical protein [Sporosarcina phage Lietuvens]|nr:hypothetical protein [Sporosarcina phage Lietuvens]
MATSAHYTQITGAVSELTAASLLMTELGYEVSKPLVDESYDLLARDPVTGTFVRIQVKTLRIRTDRDNALVVYARKGNGQAYTPDEVDMIMGVSDNHAYMFECTGLSEYWSTETSAKTRWLRLDSVKDEQQTTKSEAVI